jgi:hypothetical protein
VNIQEVFFDHPDRGVNQIPSAPYKIIFNNSEQVKQKNSEIKMNYQSHNKSHSVRTEKNYYNEMMIEKNKVNELMKEITVLKNSIGNVGKINQ